MEYLNEIEQGKLARIATIDLDRIAYLPKEVRDQSLPNFPVNQDRYNQRAWR